MALRGVKVLEMAGLAPAPFCGMILADFGATVIRVDRPQDHTLDTMARGKQSIAVNLKNKSGIDVVRRLCRTADVVLEPYRPGVMEKMGLGPEELMRENKRLIYARLTGFGQKGCYANMAGHDINYLAMSGILSMLGRHGEKPTPPINLLADFAGGGLMCALGITMALLERHQSGKGQVVDASMVQGAAYLGTFLKTSRDIGLWPNERGQNVLDTGAPFYDTFATSDGQYMAVGSIEGQFYSKLCKGLGFDSDSIPSQLSVEEWPQTKEVFAKIFASRTQEEWCKVFDGTDACVTPILSMEEAAQHPHNKELGTYFTDEEGEALPAPAPSLSRSGATPARGRQPMVGEHTSSVLLGAGWTQQEVTALAQSGAVMTRDMSKL